MIEKLIEIYENNGLEESLIYMIKNCNSEIILNTFEDFIKRVYELNGLNLIDTTFMIDLIVNIQIQKENILKIIAKNRGCREDLLDWELLNTYNKKEKELLKVLVDSINREIEKGNLTVREFVVELFKDRTTKSVDGVYLEVLNYLEAQGILVDENNDLKSLIHFILVPKKLHCPWKMVDEKGNDITMKIYGDKNLLVDELEKIITNATCIDETDNYDFAKVKK